MSRNQPINKTTGIILLGVVTAVALALRLWQLDTVPPGIHYDEAIDLRQGLEILNNGYRPIYISEGWGREALYYYFVAIMLRLVPSNLLALRLTVVVFSMGVILLSYLFARQKFDTLTALFTVGWLSVNYWALFTSRFAVRGILLSFLLLVTILVFWHAWAVSTENGRQKWLWYGAAGLFFGLTFYTYQPARFVPILFVLFWGYLFLVHRELFQQNWRGFVIFALCGLVVALPLIFVLMGQDTELDARGWLIEPLTRMLEGDFSLVWQHGIATLKMFTVSGDPLVTDNIPGRPVFVPVWTGWLFYAGFVLTLWRWRQPVYMFLLCWLFVMLAPTVLTASAPNYNRIIAAQTAVMLITALPIAEGVKWAAARWRRPVATALPVLVGMVALVTTGWATWQDYFFAWPQQEVLSTNYSGNITQAALYLNHSPDELPVVMSSRSIEDAAPYITAVLLDRPDLDFRWVDTGQAIAMPVGEEQARLLVTADRWIDQELAAYAGISLQPTYSQAQFAIFTLQGLPSHDVSPLPIYYLPSSMPGPAGIDLHPFTTSLPVNWEQTINLQTLTLPDTPIHPGSVLTFFTDWSIEMDGEGGSLALFVHLLDKNNEIVAQQDGLGYPPHSWVKGDRFVHVHRLSLSDTLPEGEYWLSVGMYRRETAVRWSIVDENGSQLGDRIVVGPIVVAP